MKRHLFGIAALNHAIARVCDWLLLRLDGKTWILSRCNICGHCFTVSRTKGHAPGQGGERSKGST